jgi:hypothetical protein
MNSPRINKIIVYSEEGPARVYTWKEDKLTFAELIALVNITGKIPEGEWLDE